MAERRKTHDGPQLAPLHHPAPLRIARHAFRILTKVEEAPTGRRTNRPGTPRRGVPPRHDTAFATAFGRVTDDTAHSPCRAVSISDTAIQPIQRYSRYKVQLGTPTLWCAPSSSSSSSAQSRPRPASWRSWRLRMPVSRWPPTMPPTATFTASLCNCATTYYLAYIARGGISHAPGLFSDCVSGVSVYLVVSLKITVPVRNLHATGRA